jgi:putative Holliday junction resolvase
MSLPSFPAKNDKPLTALGFDFGTQRIGMAFGQSVSGSARGVAVIKARDGIPDWESLARHIEQWHPDVFVVGLPYNMDGSESELLVRARKFANRLHGRFHRPVYGMDERLSSKEALEQVLEQGGKRDEAIDHIAAQIILENWFTGLKQQAPAR